MEFNVCFFLLQKYVIFYPNWTVRWIKVYNIYKNIIKLPSSENISVVKLLDIYFVIKGFLFKV